jgi:hypothetical protein
MLMVYLALNAQSQQVNLKAKTVKSKQKITTTKNKDIFSYLLAVAGVFIN